MSAPRQFLDATRWPWLPAWWAGDAMRHPTILVIHSGWKRADVAGYLADPIADEGEPQAIHCRDGLYRRAASAHFAWSSKHGGFVQMVSLDRIAWHVGGVRYRGERLQERSIGVELPGPWDRERPEAELAALRELAGALLRVVPSLQVWLRHSAVEPSRRDPGPGLPDDWADGMELGAG